MYCSKCGAQISKTDKYCPKCGAENINYVAPDITHIVNDTSGNTQNLSADETDNQKGAIKKRRRFLIPIIVIGCVVLAVVCVKLFSGINIGTTITDSSVIDTPYGITGYIDDSGNIYFLDAGTVTSFKDNAEMGRSTPEHTRFVVLSDDGVLHLHNTGEIEDTAKKDLEISKKVNEISAISNDGCFYTEGNDEHLYFYDFSKNSVIDIGMDNSSKTFSQDHNSVVGVDTDGTLSIFTVGDSAAKTLCNIDEEAEICCVADNGSNVIWSVKEGNEYSVYMLRNGAPERIGKITNSEKYSSLIGDFYHNDDSFIVYSANSSQMIRYQDDEVTELSLPGVKGYGELYNDNGMYMDSDDDYINEPYLLILKSKSSNVGGLYKLLKDGSFSLEADNIKMESFWDFAYPTYYIRNGTVYYINTEGDLYKKELGDDNESEEITTDVTSLFMPSAGGYAYIIKSGSLYYIDLSDNSNKLNLIRNKISQDDTVKVTDKGNTIYYITNTQDITDSYRSKGTVYQYVIGGDEKEIAKDIMYIQTNDSVDVCADFPIFEQYVSHEDYDYIINVGTCSEGKYKELIKSAKD